MAFGRGGGDVDCTMRRLEFWINERREREREREKECTSISE
jgi:hypothetical protein